VTRVALIGSWAIMDDDALLWAGDAVIERCPADLERLRSLVRRRRPAWLLVGAGLDEDTAAALVAAARSWHPQLRIGLLAIEDDVRAFRRWASRGCSLYLVQSTGPERLAWALASAARDVVVIDRALLPDRSDAPEELDHELTRRERDVLELVVAGLRNREIATRLHLSENTVETHLRHLFSKLQVRSRAEAVEKAIRGAFV
jgi:DNA-binding NarL/FixJ family response regulator